MSQNGGQLFTYYSNSRAARYLCPYTFQIGETHEYRNGFKSYILNSPDRIFLNKSSTVSVSYLANARIWGRALLTATG